ncbi:acetolactate synthase small subunit [Clostridium thermarum]|uniref:acetolactate synthase small subunit n=1 Tax=Clostridium thermarum TaxID=1716543 RepID=UPI0013D67F60|nr:acetolactate synthase small subunit [Clostridium thermarum]
MANNEYVVIELLVKNHPGVMLHITGLFARRAFNLEGILCGQIGDGTVSRMYLLVKDDDFLEQIVKQLRKLYDVLEVNIRYEYDYAIFHNPELMLKSDDNEWVFKTMV